MLTHCPECKGELSTSAQSCPHCGAPVDHGRLAGGGAGGPAAGVPLKAEPMSAPPKAHTLRNCCGCLFVLILLFGGAMAYLYSAAKKGWMGPEAAPGVAAQLAPSSQPPAGWAYLGADDINIFGKHMSKAVLLTPGGEKPEQGKRVPIMGAASFAVKPERRADLHELILKIVENAATGNKSDKPGLHSHIVSTTEEDMPLGQGAGIAKVSHLVTENDETKERSDAYVSVLEPFDNDFGWVVLFGTGPEKSFDGAAFKAYLASVHAKSGPGAAAPDTTPPAPATSSPAPVTASPAPVTASPAPVTASPLPDASPPADGSGK